MLTPEHLGELLAGGESLSVEFKSERTRAVNDAELVEAVVCLSNRPGERSAWLLIGVEDDGQVTGARARHEGDRTDPLRLQAHSRITRREAAELCQLGPQQTTRLLKRLVGEGRIWRHGTGKGSWYSLDEHKYDRDHKSNDRDRNDRSPDRNGK